jgi:hypothetical protein
MVAHNPIIEFVASQAAPTAKPADARELVLTLPYALKPGETAWLLVEVGVIGHTEVQLSTREGRPLGTISPFALREGSAAGTYTVPVPLDAFAEGKIALRLSLVQADGARRAPSPAEVKGIRLSIRPSGKGG